MPTFLERIKGSNAIVTNWSSFAQPNAIQGCQEELHVPLYNIACLLPCTMAVVCILRAGPQGLALFIAGTGEQLNGLQDDAGFLSNRDIQ